MSSLSAQEATPSAADAAKRADLVRRLDHIIANGISGYTGLRAEVPTDGCAVDLVPPFPPRPVTTP